MFKVRKAKKEFENFANTEIGNLTMPQAFFLLLDFYQDVRASDALPAKKMETCSCSSGEHTIGVEA